MLDLALLHVAKGNMANASYSRTLHQCNIIYNSQLLIALADT